MPKAKERRSLEPVEKKTEEKGGSTAERLQKTLEEDQKKKAVVFKNPHGDAAEASAQQEELTLAPSEQANKTARPREQKRGKDAPHKGNAKGTEVGTNSPLANKNKQRKRPQQQHARLPGELPATEHQPATTSGGAPGSPTPAWGSDAVDWRHVFGANTAGEHAPGASPAHQQTSAGDQGQHEVLKKKRKEKKKKQEPRPNGEHGQSHQPENEALPNTKTTTNGTRGGQQKGSRRGDPGKSKERVGKGSVKEKKAVPSSPKVHSNGKQLKEEETYAVTFERGIEAFFTQPPEEDSPVSFGSFTLGAEHDEGQRKHPPLTQKERPAPLSIQPGTAAHQGEDIPLDTGFLFGSFTSSSANGGHNSPAMQSSPVLDGIDGEKVGQRHHQRVSQQQKRFELREEDTADHRENVERRHEERIEHENDDKNHQLQQQQHLSAEEAVERTGELEDKIDDPQEQQHLSNIHHQLRQIQQTPHLHQAQQSHLLQHQPPHQPDMGAGWMGAYPDPGYPAYYGAGGYMDHLVYPGIPGPGVPIAPVPGGFVGGAYGYPPPPYPYPYYPPPPHYEEYPPYDDTLTYAPAYSDPYFFVPSIALPPQNLPPPQQTPPPTDSLP